MDWFVYETAMGPITLVATDAALTRLDFGDSGSADPSAEASAPSSRGSLIRRETPLLRDAARQLNAYLARETREFNLPLAPSGSDFMLSVWAALREIPYGATRSYGEIAARIGNPKASRAVGLANNRNPIPVIIPCHRVIGASGSLVGYGGGIARKRWLLSLEGALLDL